MKIVCPTLLTADQQIFHRRLDEILSLSSRVHIDLSDGEFAPSHTIQLNELRWPVDAEVDLHVMYAHPTEALQQFLARRPNLVIVHAEAEGDLALLSKTLHEHSIKVGIALLADTPVAHIRSLINLVDHILIFSGNLGYHGGVADLGLLSKVADIRALNPTIEIGWDGGINDQNIKQLADGGIDVLDVGGFIATAVSPVEAYARLKEIIQV